MIPEREAPTAVSERAAPVALAVSIVLPTHGRRRSLLRVLRALNLQRVPTGCFEVLVICDGDVDGSAAACRALAPELRFRLRVVVQRNQGPAAARNTGIAEAEAALIVFLDDDVVPDEGLIGAHLAAHAGQERLATIGPLLPPTDVRLSVWSAWEERALCQQYDAMLAGLWEATWRQFYTGNAAVRKSLLLEIGGFDQRFKRAEDVELALRLHDAGAKFVFLPEARGWHYISRTWHAWLAIPRAYGEADVALARAGRHWLFNLIREAFSTRSLVTRAVTRVCVGRPAAIAGATWLFSGLVRSAGWVRVLPMGQIACGMLFNLNYYDALARSLGGRDAFFHLVGTGATPVPPVLDEQTQAGAGVP